MSDNKPKHLKSKPCEPGFETLEPKDLLAITREQRALLTYLTEDIDNLKGKVWLAPALLSHATRTVNSFTLEQIEHFIETSID